MTRAALLVLLMTATAFSAFAGEKKTLYVQVILGSDKKPSGGNHREVGPKLSGKLSPVFRWKHYWETDRKKIEFNPARVTRVALENHRTLEIERLKSGELEVRLIRRTGLVTKARQPGKGGMAILGGEESSRDSFFVVVRSDEPANRE